MYIVVARYNETLDWLFNVLDLDKSYIAHIYNDGSDIDVPVHLQDRCYVYAGDKIPSEPTKYIKFVLDNWDTLLNERVLFLQGDPLYHNPTLLECIKHIDKWDWNYQNLTLLAHPPPWGCSTDILSNKAPNVTVFGDNAAVWHDIMDDSMHGEYFKDPFWTEILQKFPFINVSYFAALFNFKPPPMMKKCYAACFSSSSHKLKSIPKHTWEALYQFIETGCQLTSHTSQKTRAIFMEYLWAIIIEGEH